MKTFVPLFNMKSSSFFRGNAPLPTVREVCHSEDYVTMPEVVAEDIEEVYEILNIRHPEAHVEAVNQLAEIHGLAAFPRLHTSMSVGDCIIEWEKGVRTVWFCDDCGWEKLPEVRK